MNATLLNLLARNWSAVLLRGICGVLFGLLALIWPGLTLFTLIVVYGIFVAAEGIFAIVAAIRGGTMAPRWWLALAGIVGLAAGALTFLWPGITALVLLLIIGGCAIARGIFEIAGAIQLRKEIDNEWLLIISGILSVLFGLFVIISPGAGALALIWLIGAYALAAGILCIGLALRLKKHHAASAASTAPAAA